MTFGEKFKFQLDDQILLKARIVAIYSEAVVIRTKGEYRLMHYRKDDLEKDAIKIEDRQDEDINNEIEYKSITARIYYSADDKCICGVARPETTNHKGIKGKGLILFDTQNALEVERIFHEDVDAYLETLERNGLELV
jgi:hypothetical protein